MSQIYETVILWYNGNAETTKKIRYPFLLNHNEYFAKLGSQKLKTASFSKLETVTLKLIPAPGIVIDVAKASKVTLA